MSTWKRFLLVGLVISVASAIAIPTLVSASHGRGAGFVGRLAGSEEVPGPGDEDGTGRVSTRINRDHSRLCYNLGWRGIGAPTAAHIHQGSKGEAGEVVATLFTSDTALPETIAGVRGCIDIPTDDWVDAFIENPANYYVNVHNAEFPGGAVRGQLRTARDR